MAHFRVRRGMGLAAALVLGLAGCSTGGADKAEEQPNREKNRITLTVVQIDEVPRQPSRIEEAIEAYTHTDLDIEWIPNAAYEDKLQMKLPRGELPMMLRVKSIRPLLQAVQSGAFWEIGPYLGEYPNLAAQEPRYYENIKVNGKVYGIPLFRDMARSAVVLREDWMEQLGLQPPASVDDWYRALKAMRERDPDGNGQEDTYGLVLGKKYNDGTAALMTRLAVSLGAPNKWGVDSQGRFTPEFLSPAYREVMSLFRRLYAEGLINRDFAVLDDAEAEKLYNTGHAGIRITVAQNAQSMQERLGKHNPKGRYSVHSPEGPLGKRTAGEAGNNGMLLFPKSTVKSEEELGKLLAFSNALLEEPMSTLLHRGIEDVHYTRTADGKTQYKDLAAFLSEVKPYRDNLVSVPGYQVPPLLETPLEAEIAAVLQANHQHAVPNPALTLTTEAYMAKGQELDQLIQDAQTQYIMGKLDEQGWEQEVLKWRQAGGDQLIAEYEEAYREQAGQKPSPSP